MNTIEEKPKVVKKVTRTTKKETEKSKVTAAPKKRAQKPKESPHEVQATQDAPEQSEVEEDADQAHVSEEEPVPKKPRGRPAKSEKAPKNSNTSSTTTKKGTSTSKTSSKDAVQMESADQSEEAQEEEVTPKATKTGKKAPGTKPKKSTRADMVTEPQEDVETVQETQDELMAANASDISEPEVKETRKARGRPAGKSVVKKAREMDDAQVVKEHPSAALKGRKRVAPVIHEEVVDEDIEMDGEVKADEIVNNEDDFTTDSHKELIQRYEQLQLSYKGLRELKETDLESNFKEMQENVKKQNLGMCPVSGQIVVSTQLTFLHSCNETHSCA